MPVKIIYKNRRHDTDRRKSLVTDYVPEKRSGVDRRNLDEKLKHLIEHSISEQNKEKKTPTQPSSGKIILRKKGDKDKDNGEEEVLK